LAGAKFLQVRVQDASALPTDKEWRLLRVIGKLAVASPAHSRKRLSGSSGHSRSVCVGAIILVNLGQKEVETVETLVFLARLLHGLRGLGAAADAQRITHVLQ
jgi:hypothetical protein